MYLDMTPVLVAAAVATSVSTHSYPTTEDMQMADAVPVHKKGHKAPAKPKFGEPKPTTVPQLVPPVRPGTETVLPDGAVRRDN